MSTGERGNRGRGRRTVEAHPGKNYNFNSSYILDLKYTCSLIIFEILKPLSNC